MNDRSRRVLMVLMTYVDAGMIRQASIIQEGDVLLLPVLAQWLAALFVQESL